MEKIFNILSISVGTIGGITAYLFGAFDTILITLLIVMVLDYISGIIKAVYTKKLSSHIGFHGLLKKIVILIIVALSTVIQRLMGNNIMIREIVIMFYITNEGISILENTAEVSPNMPEKLKEILLQLRNN